MKLIIHKDRLEIKTESITDEVYIAKVLGMEKENDEAIIKRFDYPAFDHIVLSIRPKLPSMREIIRRQGEQGGNQEID